MKAAKITLRLLVGALVLCLTSCFCFGPAPGKGQKARAGFRAAAPVIQALEKFREDHGQYPADLSELVPKYLPDHKALLVRGKVDPLHSPRAAESAPPKGFSLLDAFWYRRNGAERLASARGDSE